MPIEDKFKDIVEVKEVEEESNANLLLANGWRLIDKPKNKLIFYTDPEFGPNSYSGTIYFLGRPVK
mgnify:FL=1